MNFLFKTVVYLNRKGEHKTTGEIMVGFIMAVVVMLFLPWIVVLLRHRYTAPVVLPPEFGLSTLVLVGATWLLQLTRQHKENDRYKQLRKTVALQFVLTIVFLLVQFWGSRKIFALVQYRDLKIVALIVIIHALHLCVTMAFLISLLLKTRTVRSAADWYIYFLNPKHQFVFKHSLVFWNFFCVLWVGLYIMMVVKFS